MSGILAEEQPVRVDPSLAEGECLYPSVFISVLARHDHSCGENRVSEWMLAFLGETFGAILAQDARACQTVSDPISAFHGSGAYRLLLTISL